MVKIYFYPLEVVSKSRTGGTYVELYGRTMDNDQICVIDRTMKPHFYVIVKDSITISKLRKLQILKDDKVIRVASFGSEGRDYLGRRVTATKLIMNNLNDLYIIRRELAKWEGIIEILEDDIPLARKYMLKKNIIPGSLCEATGEFVERNYKIPCLDAESVEPSTADILEEPRVLAFDIETHSRKGLPGTPEQDSVIMLSFHARDFRKVITWKRFSEREDYVEIVGGEAALLTRFKEVIDAYKPDILVGFDSDDYSLPYLVKRAEKYNIKLELGADNSPLNLGSSRRITGITYLDIYKFIMNMGEWLKRDYKVYKTANILIKEKKNKFNLKALENAWNSPTVEIGEYCKYSLDHSLLILKMFNSTHSLLSELAKLTGLPYSYICRTKSAQITEYFMIKEFYGQEFIPKKPRLSKIEGRIKNEDLSIDVKKGVYQNVVRFPIHSLYTQVMITNNISFDTLYCDCCSGEFCSKQEGILISVIKRMISRRDKIIEILGKKDEPNLMLLARKTALNLVINSAFPYLSSPSCRWYSSKVIRKVEDLALPNIAKMVGQIKKAGFTFVCKDYFYVIISLDKREELNKLGEVLKKSNFSLQNQTLYKSLLLIDVEDTGSTSKKRYIAIDYDNFVEYVGFDMILWKYSNIAKQTLEESSEILLKEENVDKAMNLVRGRIRKIKEGEFELEDLVISTTLKKEINEYDKMNAHVEAAKRLRDKGLDVGKNSVINYVIIRGSEMIRDRARLVSEVDLGEIDTNYYIHNQIISLVEPIFNLFGVEKETLLKDEGQSGLEGFV